MTKEQQRRNAIKRRQDRLETILVKTIMTQIILITIIVIAWNMSLKAKNNAEQTNVNVEVEHESKNDTDYQVTTDALQIDIVTEAQRDESKTDESHKQIYFSDEDKYLLAKIAMAEAEGVSFETKVKVIMCVLNRVDSDQFPNNIHDVIFQKKQFSPVDDGRWDSVEPNEECWNAVDYVELLIFDGYEDPDGALYFECCDFSDNWHANHLQYLYSSDGVNFYK